MHSKHHRTLQAIFCRPAPGTLVFRDIEALLLAVGCELTEGAGSRVRFDKDGFAFLCHRSHPGKEAKRYQMEQAREFLSQIGVEP
ncbi:type II toxin-antitoxin system HicA family toxin [Melaminivora jejuensis]|uniref:type II toxin-antitoxin system HicA family toxin n=1 Tax=Melaminivora jejuensis TaxID=1267217 RepID=UPI001ADFD21D|nr:type II toxin-antitoxin system HicA family toxin [Melaminivora jejuensis]UHJ65700.1 type II toxin-antitoxin system HicA family toxin [Melaminivora jejuensis]